MSIEKKMPGKLVNQVRSTEDSTIFYEACIIPTHLSDSSLYGIIRLEKVKAQMPIPFFLMGKPIARITKKKIFKISAGEEELDSGRYNRVEFPQKNLFGDAYKRLIENAEKEDIQLSKSSFNELFSPIEKELMDWYSD